MFFYGLISDLDVLMACRRFVKAPHNWTATHTSMRPPGSPSCVRAPECHRGNGGQDESTTCGQPPVRTGAPSPANCTDVKEKSRIHFGIFPVFFSFLNVHGFTVTQEAKIFMRRQS